MRIRGWIEGTDSTVFLDITFEIANCKLSDQPPQKCTQFSFTGHTSLLTDLDSIIIARWLRSQHDEQVCNQTDHLLDFITRLSVQWQGKNVLIISNTCVAPRTSAYAVEGEPASIHNDENTKSTSRKIKIQKQPIRWLQSTWIAGKESFKWSQAHSIYPKYDLDTHGSHQIFALVNLPDRPFHPHKPVHKFKFESIWRLINYHR